MTFTQLVHLLLIALSGQTVLGAAHFPEQKDVKLFAAYRKGAHRVRNDMITFHHEAELLYAGNGGNAQGSKNRIATVNIKSDRPILILEDNEHLLYDIDCTTNTIALSRAASAPSWDSFTFQALTGGHIITSHDGCNADAERRNYKIHSVTNITESSVVFAVERQSWKSSFSSIDISLQTTDAGHGIRSHGLVRRWLQARQGSASPSPLTAVLSAVVVPTPSAFPTKSGSQALDLDLNGLALTNHPLVVPSDFPGELICLNCSLFGNIDLAFSNWGFSDDGVQGTVTATTHDVGAYIELSANLSQSQTWSIPLAPQIPHFSVEIADIGKAAMVVGPYIYGGYHMDGIVGISSGFAMTIPDGASIDLNVQDILHPTYTGFDAISYTVIPPQSDALIQSVKAWVALRLAIGASFSFSAMNDELSGGMSAGAYLDAPVLSANFTPVADVDADCNPLSDQSSKARNILTSPIRIDYSAGWAVGAYLDANYDMFTDRKTDDHGAQVGGNVLAGHTACRNFDSKTGSYESAKKAVSDAKSAGARAAAPLGLVVGAALMAVSVLMCWA